MKKPMTSIIEAFSVYTLIHVLMHILPIIIALGVSGNLEHSHAESHLFHDAIFLTLVSHLALPLFAVYTTKTYQSHQLYAPVSLLHRH